MVFLNQKYFMFSLFLLINQPKYFNAPHIEPPDESESQSKNSTDLITSDISELNDEKETFNIKENASSSFPSSIFSSISFELYKPNQNKEKGNEEKAAKNELIETQKMEKEDEKKGEEPEKIKTEKDGEEKEETETKPTANAEKENKKEINPFDSYDGCEDFQPINGLKGDCTAQFKINKEGQNCCYMTIHYKYNDFNLCIRMSKDKNEIKKKIKEIEEEYEGCDSIDIDCFSNFIKYSFLFLSVFLVL